MPEEKQTKKIPRRRKTPETVREHAEKSARKKEHKSSKLKGKIHRPLSVLRKVGGKEYHPIPLPDNKAGRILGKKVHIIPKFFKEAWAELKQVTWPSRMLALKLTLAVFVFAIIFATFIQLLDMGFNRLFEIILLS